jgi:hypothetical protein
MLKIKQVGLMGRVSECAKGREGGGEKEGECQRKGEIVGERRREGVKEREREGGTKRGRGGVRERGGK